jgi:hypothetical protein
VNLRTERPRPKGVPGEWALYSVKAEEARSRSTDRPQGISQGSIRMESRIACSSARSYKAQSTPQETNGAHEVAPPCIRNAGSINISPAVSVPHVIRKLVHSHKGPRRLPAETVRE